MIGTDLPHPVLRGASVKPHTLTLVFAPKERHEIYTNKPPQWLLGVGAAVLLTATPAFALLRHRRYRLPTRPAMPVSSLSSQRWSRSTNAQRKNNITHFSVRTTVQTTLHTLENVNVANMFGETARASRSRSTRTIRARRLLDGRRQRSNELATPVLI